MLVLPSLAASASPDACANKVGCRSECAPPGLNFGGATVTHRLALKHIMTIHPFIVQSAGFPPASRPQQPAGGAALEKHAEEEMPSRIDKIRRYSVSSACSLHHKPNIPCPDAPSSYFVILYKGPQCPHGWNSIVLTSLYLCKGPLTREVRRVCASQNAR